MGSRRGNKSRLRSSTTRRKKPWLRLRWHLNNRNDHESTVDNSVPTTPSTNTTPRRSSLATRTHRDHTTHTPCIQWSDGSQQSPAVVEDAISSSKDNLTNNDHAPAIDNNPLSWICSTPNIPFTPRTHQNNTITTTPTSCVPLVEPTQEDQTLMDMSTSERREKKIFQLEGRRIIQIQYFMTRLKEIGIHKPFGCSFVDMDIVGESRSGLRSTFTLKCPMCNFKCNNASDDPANTMSNTTYMDVNTAAVLGTLSMGGGHAQLEEIVSVLDMPCMSKTTWLKYHDQLDTLMQATSLQLMLEAGQEEARLAGDVDASGVPLVIVVADGAWAKRSYRVNFNSASGVVVIVGYRTKKILYIGIRNKYCSYCEFHEHKYPDKDVPEHKCYKNWTGSSTGMEADAIVEGFRQSKVGN